MEIRDKAVLKAVLRRTPGVAVSTKKNQTITGEELDDTEDQSDTRTEEHRSARART